MFNLACSGCSRGSLELRLQKSKCCMSQAFETISIVVAYVHKP